MNQYRRRMPIRRRLGSFGIFTIFIFIALCYGIVSIYRGLTHGDNLTEAGKIAEETRKKKAETPIKLDLQLPINQWVATQDADDSGIIIFDLDNNAVVGKHNENKSFRIESIYKMFVAYEGYRRISQGTYQANDTALNQNSYDGKPYTLELCLDHMVRYSFSSCAESVWNRIGRKKLQKIYDDKGFSDTEIAGLTSTASEIKQLYQIFWRHEDLSEDTWAKIKDSMLNQTAPKSAADIYTSNWRQGLPSGFNTAKVYNKVGWLGDGDGNWLYYSDAAFLEFQEVTNQNDEKKPARHFIMVVLTKNTRPKEIKKLGQKVEAAIRSADTY